MSRNQLWRRREFLGGLAAGATIALRGHAAQPAEDRTTGRFIRLATNGGDRATGYVMSNKIARHGNKLLCTWLNVARQNCWALVDPKADEPAAGDTVGPVRSDNHCGAALATDTDGTVHLLIGAHHGPFLHYRMPPDEGRWIAVDEDKPVGDTGTYPSLVCDSQGTLHATYRYEPGGRNARLAYCRRPRGGQWSKPRLLTQSAVSEHSWLTNAIEVGPKDRLHAVISNTLPVPKQGPDARYFGASHLYSDDAGETWRQFGHDGALEPLVASEKLERIEGRTLAADRTEAKYAGPNGPLHSYYHKMVLSNPVVDDEGWPWVIVHNLLQGDAALYHFESSRGWVGVALREAAAKLWPESHIRHCGQLARHRDGTLEAVLMLSPAAATGWGAKETTLARLTFSTGGQLLRSQLVRPLDAAAPQWLPSIERYCPHAALDRPALLYTRGLNAGGYSNNKNSVETEVWVEIA